MNVEQAKGVDLCAILKQLGYVPAKQYGQDLMYYSPFRKEKTASFHVNSISNVWYDHGEGKGGNVIDFVCGYLASRSEDSTVADALRWLTNMNPVTVLESQSQEESFDYGPVLELLGATTLQCRNLLNYLESRGITLAYAKKYLKEVQFRNGKKGKSYYAIGILNENGGYSLRNKFFKGCIAPQGISFIRGKKVLPNEIHIFEGFFDYLSALSFQKIPRFEGDTIILNSTNNLSQSFPYIKNYSYKTVYSWLDNDKTGKQAAQNLSKMIAEEGNLKLGLMNSVYKGFKDVNEWHMHRFQLKK